MSLQADITTLLGGVADGHFYLQTLPPEYELPAVVFRTISNEPNLTLCGNAGKRRHIVVFECWAKRWIDAENLATEIKDALAADTTLLSYEETNPGEEFEPVDDEYLEPVYYGFWH